MEISMEQVSLVGSQDKISLPPDREMNSNFELPSKKRRRSKSTKSGLDLPLQVVKKKKDPDWRLGKTLSRQTRKRPIELEDMRFIWAAYSKGCLASMGEKFADGKMESARFDAEFQNEVLTNYDAVWTLFADCGERFIPVGLILGFFSHQDPKFSPFMIIGDMIWFHWASPRNKIESSVNFFTEIRDEIHMVEYARKQHQKFFNMLCAHGILRRAGTSYVVYPGEATAVYETRPS